MEDVEQLLGIFVRAGLKLPDAAKVRDGGEGQQRKLVRIALVQLVIDVLQRADAEAGDVAHRDGVPLTFQHAPQPVDQIFGLIADARAGQLRRVTAAGFAVIGVNKAARAEIVRDRSGGQPARFQLLRECDHHTGLAAAEKAAEYKKAVFHPHLSSTSPSASCIRPRTSSSSR